MVRDDSNDIASTPTWPPTEVMTNAVTDRWCNRSVDDYTRTMLAAASHSALVRASLADRPTATITPRTEGFSTTAQPFEQVEQTLQLRITTRQQIANLLLTHSKFKNDRLWIDRLPEMVRLVEESLYQRASCLEEYFNPQTLRDRLKSIVRSFRCQLDCQPNLVHLSSLMAIHRVEVFSWCSNQQACTAHHVVVAFSKEHLQDPDRHRPKRRRLE